MSCSPMRRLLTSLAFVLALAPALLAAQGATEEYKGFWNRNDATNFNGRVTPNSSESFAYKNHPATADRAKEAALRRNVPAVAPQKTEDLEQLVQSDTSADRSPPASTPLNREQIVAKYGAPDQPQLIRAQKDAPPAMQGLFEALNSNDKELAWQYALSLARRQVDMQTTVSKATDYQLLAMEALGLRPPSSEDQANNPINPTRAELDGLIRQTQAEELRRRVNIDAALAAEQAYGTENSPLHGALSNIPVDPEGKIKLLIFFDEKDAVSASLAESIKPLREKFKGDTNFSVMGLTKRTYTAQGLKLRGAELSFPFPLVNGEALALDLRIRSYPSFVFLAMTSKETYRVEGIPSMSEIEKTVRAMRGGK